MKKKNKMIVALTSVVFALIVALSLLYYNKASLKIMSQMFQKPILIPIEKRTVAGKEDSQDNATFSDWIQGQEKDKLLVWSKRDILVWENGKKIFVAYKKGGKQYKKQQIFTYQFPKGCAPECINFPNTEVSGFDGIKKYYDYDKTGNIPKGGPIE